MALRFPICTASRTGEGLGATWDERYLDCAMWTFPAERMKSGREHRVRQAARAWRRWREMVLIST